MSCSKDAVMYTLTTSANPSDGGTVSPSTQQYEEGETATITATPSAEYVFQSWSGATGSSNSTSVVMNSDKSVTANFVKKQYPLTIEIEGEGTVSETVIKQGLATDYNSGTIVELTAEPTGDWEFVEWTGDITSTENPVQITIDKPKTVKAIFKNNLYELKTQIIDVSYNQSYDIKKLRNGFTREGVAGSFTLNILDTPFLWISGTSSMYEDINPSSSDDVEPNPSLLFKKNNGSWELKKIYENVKTWGVRNYKIKNNLIVIGDGNEIGSPNKWGGNAFIGEIEGEEISWKMINQISGKKYFHGITFGDLNGDNIIDVGGFPGYHLYIGGGSGFDYVEGYLANDNQVIKHSVDSFSDKLYGNPFTGEFEDLDGDGVPEIITAYYTDNPSFRSNEWRLRNLNNLLIYKRNNSSSNKYEFYWGSENPYKFYPENTPGNQTFGATSIKVADFNNDGINDIAVARERGDYYFDVGDLAFDIWLGNNDGSYNQTFAQFFKSEDLEWREFNVMDVNKDGLLDIVLNSNGGKTFYINKENTTQGISFNSSIWINKGDGSFNSYSLKELNINDFKGEKIKPYLLNGDFHLIGISTDMSINNYEENKLPLEFYDLKLNL
ncbi:VCBS repeat-containing protein [Flavobacteriaceae bacterium]|nr:VCBS repeat-containing protein [Flavobacteriaceae bacterium]